MEECNLTTVIEDQLYAELTMTLGYPRDIDIEHYRPVIKECFKQMWNAFDNTVYELVDPYNPSTENLNLYTPFKEEL